MIAYKSIITRSGVGVRFSGCKRLWPVAVLAFRAIAAVCLAAHLGTAMAIVSASPANAEDISLSFPVECEPGKNCWVVKLLDTERGPGATDAMCGTLVANKHNGTDIAVRNTAAADRLFAVLAAAPGRVSSVRDSMEDTGYKGTDPAILKKRACGNRVVIRHDDEWQTRYCHLRKGSMRVVAGQQVRRGQQIALVGLSGSTAYPHLHLTVLRNGVAVDPYTGSGMGWGCGKSFGSLWEPDLRAKISYRSTAILDIGFIGDRPDWKLQPHGYRKSKTLSRGQSFYVWVDIFGNEVGDSVRFEVFGPGRKRIRSKVQILEKTKLRRTLFLKVSKPTLGWRRGDFTVEVTHLRDDDNGTVRTEADAIAEMR